MKKLYSSILLFSFCIGVLQPAAPMAERFSIDQTLFKSLFTGEHGSFIPDITDHVSLPADNKDNDEHGQEPLLDGEYYPVPVQINSGKHATFQPVKVRDLIYPKYGELITWQNIATPPPRQISPPLIALY
jgi:hypothetical protein